MSNEAGKKSGLIMLIAVLAVVAFAGWYYYYQQKDKETLFDVNVGGENFSATVEQE